MSPRRYRTGAPQWYALLDHRVPEPTQTCQQELGQVPALSLRGPATPSDRHRAGAPRARRDEPRVRRDRARSPQSPAALILSRAGQPARSVDREPHVPSGGRGDFPRLSGVDSGSTRREALAWLTTIELWDPDVPLLSERRGKRRPRFKRGHQGVFG